MDDLSYFCRAVLARSRDRRPPDAFFHNAIPKLVERLSALSSSSSGYVRSSCAQTSHQTLARRIPRCELAMACPEDVARQRQTHDSRTGAGISTRNIRIWVVRCACP